MSKKPYRFTHKCCYNCWHHLAFEFHPSGDTIVCPFEAQKVYKAADGTEYVGVDYSKKKPADSRPCSKWKIDTNIPKGSKWEFLEPVQLELAFNF